MKAGITLAAAFLACLMWASPAVADDAPAPAAPAPAPAAETPPAPPPASAATVVACCPEPQCCNPGLKVTAGALFAKIRRSDTVYASLDDGQPPVGTTSDAPEVAFDYEIGFRAGVNWTACGDCCWDYGVTVTFLSAEGDDAFSAPIGLPVGTVTIFPCQTGSSVWDEDYLAIDADVGYTFCGACFSARAYGGVRFLSIQEDVARTYSTGGISLVANSSTEMTAVGLHAGIEPRVKLCSGFSVWGRFGGGVLLGTFDWTYDELRRESGDPDTPLATASKSVDQDLTVIEAALGLSWETSRLFGCVGMRVTAGYELTRYSFIDFRPNVISGPLPAVAIEDGSYGVDGFFLTVDFLF